MTQPRLVLLHALSPLHCGTGHAVGGIDLPIAREKATKIPLVPGSSLKGVLRARGAVTDADKNKHKAAFGPDTADAADHAGALQFSDLRLTILPVRSLRGTFAWLTSPYLLTRFARDAREAGVGGLPKLPSAPGGDERALVAKDSLVVEGDKLVLEEFDFATTASADVGALGAWFANALLTSETEEERARFARRFAIISDDVMAQLLDASMEITTRVRLEAETKTVARGALWTEEALPVESVLTGLLACTPVTRAPEGSAKELLAYAEELTSRAVQIGGKASVGRGVCRLRVLGGA
jgi:CRISPR-associated protein Cmr4